MEQEVIYLEHANTVNVKLLNNGSAVDLTSVTSMSLTFPGSTSITSTNTSAQGITWAVASYVTGEVRLHLGGFTTLTTGMHDASLVVFDAVDTAGVVWGDIPIKIKAKQTAT